MKLYSPQECMEYWQTQRPIRSGKTIWLSIMKCIEYAIKQDEIARELSNIRTDLAEHDKQIKDETIANCIKALKQVCAKRPSIVMFDSDIEEMEKELEQMKEE